jgi:hypothetical protein
MERLRQEKDNFEETSVRVGSRKKIWGKGGDENHVGWGRKCDRLEAQSDRKNDALKPPG